MSRKGKRGVEEAFGKDASTTRSGPPKKSRQERAHERKQNGPSQKSPRAEKPGSLPKQNEETTEKHQTTAATSTESPKVAKEAIIPKQASPKTTRETENKPSNPSSAQVERKKPRSKRYKKPEFDNSKSHIELVLSNVKDESDDVIEPDQQLAEKRKDGVSKRRSSDNTGSRKHRHKQEKSLAHRQRSPHDWTISRPTGGAFIDHDPILTSDEQFLILATKQDILIYSTKTSLLVRTITVASRSEIVTYAQTPLQEQFIVVGLSNGDLRKYDWTNGRKTWTTSFNGSITGIVPTSSGADSDGYLMIARADDGSHNLSSLAIGGDGRLLGRRHMLSQKHILEHICFSAELGVSVVCSKDTIFIGQLGELQDDKEAPMRLHEVSVVGKIMCFDAQILPAAQQSGKVSTQPLINVAVGLKSGEIQMFGNVLNKVGQSRSSDLQPRRLHWHRAAPRTVKFSPDSNYLISGGEETVLVIWQLDTNQKQTLPHLTTAILNASISHQGSAYALRLADNSMMVLSTSDLRPFANVGSLAFDASSTAPFLPGLSTPAVLHPNHSDRLLLAYSLQNLNPSLKPSQKSSNMLQTYDVASQLQLSRQALARSLVSTVNIGPGGELLHEPDVTHLDISHDGKWLVTVDQWSPSESDLKEMYLSRGEQFSRERLNECFLRFWSTNAGVESSATDLWELNTRIDEPVSPNDFSRERKVLAIAINPVKLQVAVADSTRHLKLYSPKARFRSGVPIKDADGQQLFTWTCDQDLPFQEAAAVPDPSSATVAFSEDGSVLAASWTATTAARARVHLIGTRTSATAASLPAIVSAGRSQLGFYRQYLLALSDKFCIYDTVTMQEVFAIDIEDRFNHGKSRMAVDTRSGVVAVSVSERDVKQPSQLLLLDVGSSDKAPILQERVPSQVQILLADNSQGGFLLVDGEGRTMKVSPPGGASTSLVVKETFPEKAIVRSSLENVFGTGGKEAAPALTQQAEGTHRASLDEVFTIDSSAQAPGALDLFNQVALVVSGAAA